MTDVKALLHNLRKEDSRFDEAQAVVDLVSESGDMLRRIRERANLSQAEMADRLGISVGRISQLESGTLRHAPSLKMLARYAHACGETVGLAASGERAAEARADTEVGIAEVAHELAVLRQEMRALRAQQAQQAPGEPPLLEQDRDPSWAVEAARRAAVRMLNEEEPEKEALLAETETEEPLVAAFAPAKHGTSEAEG